MKVLKGEVQLLYITPENIVRNKLYRNILLSTKYKQCLTALVVDEAHCIKLWGEDFRQTFSEIGNIRSLIPSGVNVMALTATTTSETYHCALIQLAMTDTVLIVSHRQTLLEKSLVTLAAFPCAGRMQFDDV